jgi:hypothetical protein
MRPNLILHIGHSKTGTSSIQRCLGARRDALLDEGVLYPSSPGGANHGLLPASLVPVRRLKGFNPALWEGLGPEGRLDKFRRDFIAEMSDLDPRVRTIIISAEQCGGLLTNVEDITKLRDLLAPYVGDVRVVMYLRRQDQHYASSYTQALRVATIRPAALPDPATASLAFYDYAALLGRWAEVFGEAAIFPRVFERGALLDGDAVDDFLAFCGLALRVPKDDPDRQSNQSISPEGLALVRVMGARLDRSLDGGLGPDNLLWRRFVQLVSDALPGKGWRPSPAESAAFQAYYKDSNETVRRRWLPERETLFDESDLVGAEPQAAAAPPADDSAAALDAACALVLREIDTARRRDAEQALRVGRLQEKLGERAAARSSYVAALRYLPEHADAHFSLGQLDVSEGDLPSAEARLEALLRLDPDNPLVERLGRRLKAARKAPAG